MRSRRHPRTVRATSAWSTSMPSVISSSSMPGDTPVETRQSRTKSTRPGLRNCRGETLIATLSIPRPACSHAFSCRHASMITSWPTSSMTPVSSATGMNRARPGSARAPVVPASSGSPSGCARREPSTRGWCAVAAAPVDGQAQVPSSVWRASASRYPVLEVAVGRAPTLGTVHRGVGRCGEAPGGSRRPPGSSDADARGQECWCAPVRLFRGQRGGDLVGHAARVLGRWGPA